MRTPPASPRDTIAKLIHARSTADYQTAHKLIAPQYASDVVATLVAVDSFLLANGELCDLVRAKVGMGAAQMIDQGSRAYHMDVFSKYVELLDETVTGQAASVSFLVDGRLPARHTQLRLIDGTWRYDPGPGDYRQLAEAFNQMAYGLRQVTDGIRKGLLPLEKLRQHPDVLIEEVRVRLLPGVRMLPAPPASETKP